MLKGDYVWKKAHLTGCICDWCNLPIESIHVELPDTCGLTHNYHHNCFESFCKFMGMTIEEIPYEDNGNEGNAIIIEEKHSKQG